MADSDHRAVGQDVAGSLPGPAAQILHERGEEMATLELGKKYGMTYADANGKVTEREFVPLYDYKVFDPTTGEVWNYVKALDLLRCDFRSFNLDRIQEISGAGEAFPVPPMYYPAANDRAGRDPVLVAVTDFENDEQAAAKGWVREPRSLRRAKFVSARTTL